MDEVWSTLVADWNNLSLLLKIAVALLCVLTLSVVVNGGSKND